MDWDNDRRVIKDILRVMVLLLFIGGVSFLCLLQRVRARELDSEISRLNRKKSMVIKSLNQLDYTIEQMKAPERIIPLAKQKLGMHESGQKREE